MTTFSYSGGDFFGYTANGFYNWLWRDGQLYFSMFRGGSSGSIHVATPDGAPVVLRNEEALRTLTAGPYVGVAYRAAPRGIERIADLRIEFRPDGTYRLDSRSRLRPRNAPYGPRDEGPYFLLTERHLYLGRAWSDGGLSAAGIADVWIEGDRLSFTSFGDDAYFVFERE